MTTATPRSDNDERCPGCHVNLRGEPIPIDLQPSYGVGYFERKIGYYDRDLDRVVEWICPDCGHRWPR